MAPAAVKAPAARARAMVRLRDIVYSVRIGATVSRPERVVWLHRNKYDRSSCRARSETAVLRMARTRRTPASPCRREARMLPDPRTKSRYSGPGPERVTGRLRRAGRRGADEPDISIAFRPRRQRRRSLEIRPRRTGGRLARPCAALLRLRREYGGADEAARTALRRHPADHQSRPGAARVASGRSALLGAPGHGVPGGAAR